jgi:hypothetical protein
VDDEFTALQRLAKRVQHTALVFRRFVKEKDPTMCP